MAPPFHLVRPIFGFWSECGTVITIPPKAVLQLVISKNGLGLCTALWNGRLVMAFRDDIENNAISLERLGDSAQSGDLTPNTEPLPRQLHG
jgi:hypothetical protein